MTDVLHRGFVICPDSIFRIPEYHISANTVSAADNHVERILGAAAGYNCEEIQEYVKDNEIKIGVTGTNQEDIETYGSMLKLSPRDN